LIEIPEQLTCLFSAKVEPQDDSYVIEVPKSEVEDGCVNPNHDYQLALFSLPTASKRTVEPCPETSPDSQQPPVTEGETRIVEIEDIGDQGDGLTRVERGFVIIVGDTEKGEEVRIKIDTVRENVAFANVVERISYYD
jgi:predicted RNA-binding protein with TRAM domain